MESIIKGIGTDIIEIPRLERAIQRHGERFIIKIFTERERNYSLKFKNPFPHFAGRFAAKEAISKAMGTGMSFRSWHEIEILNNEYGAPQVILSEPLKKEYSRSHFHLSISHCKEYALATALLVEEVH